MHDAAGRLLRAQRAQHAEVFAYDDGGAMIAALERLITHRKPPTPNFDVAAGGVVQRTDKAKYTYDKRGRRVVELSLGQAKGGERRAKEYRWDGHDRLREVRLPDGRHIRFDYDAFGRRTEKSVVRAGVIERSVRFLWDGLELAGEIDSERGARWFVHRRGTFAPLLQEERGEVFTYVNDDVGAPKELIDPGGNVAWSAAHSAFGRVIDTFVDQASAARRGYQVESPFRMLGQYADEETGLCHTLHRYFDPAVGGWCSPDPLGIEGGDGLFAFNGSPLRDTDPLGLTADHAGPPPNNGVGGGSNVHGGKDHNDAIDKEVAELKEDPTVSNIRKNQQQVDVNGNNVGTGPQYRRAGPPQPRDRHQAREQRQAQRSHRGQRSQRPEPIRRVAAESMKNPVRDFSSITVSCFEVGIDAVWSEYERIFSRYKITVDRKPGPIPYERFGPDPNPGARGQQRVALVPHRRPNGDPTTAMMTNMIDGWTTLATRASKELGCRCWQFTVCQKVKYPRNFFHLMDAGVTKRVVSAMLDSTKWVFFEQGPRLPFEVEANYTKRLVKERLPRDYVLTLANHAGFPIADDAFWVTGPSSILIETRTHS